MKIFVTGTRGIPDIPGGVEKHCQELYPLIMDKGHEVVIATRKPYVKKFRKEWQGVQLFHLYAPKVKSLEAIIHTFLGVLKARFWHADIIHIHGIGPGLMVPLARLLGMTVVATNHGPDYERQKWGRAAKAMLLLGEWVSGKFANEVIVISKPIQATVQKRCGRKSTIIYNGVNLSQKSKGIDFLNLIGVEPNKYIIAVSRIVPEKGLHLLAEAFKQLDTNYKLVVVGGADHESDYSRNLKKIFFDDERIIHTGYVMGEPLKQIYSHSCLFVLPSFIEGLPIALLEALSYGLPVLVSDIPANREVGLFENQFFKCGDVNDLALKIETRLSQPISNEETNRSKLLVAEKYNWKKIADQTIEIYSWALGVGSFY